MTKTISVSAPKSVSHETVHHAGAINISITKQDDIIQVTGSHALSLNPQEQLHLLARGGDGADGKIGADGLPGETGTDGYGATRYKRGTNGTAGSNGKHGEKGGHGGPSGDGGSIDIWVTSNELSLLDVIGETDVSAGIPGKRGRHGRGGAGGKGGAGGESFTFWVMKDEKSDGFPHPREEHHHRDGHHHRHGEHVHPHAEHHHYPHHHHGQSHQPHRRYDHSDEPDSYSQLLPGMRFVVQPGGKNGPDGHPGGAFTEPLHDGVFGHQGQVRFHIQSGLEGNSVHEEPYKLVMKKVSFQSTQNSCLWEPGDVISAVYSITNTARTMPSPSGSIPLRLRMHDDLESIQDGEIAGNIFPGSQHLSQDIPVCFKIKARKRVHDQPKPYRSIIPVCVEAYNTYLGQAFKNVLVNTELTVQYPVELIELRNTHFSIGAEEKQSVEVQVRNNSNRDLGKEAKRDIIVEIALTKDKEILFSHSVSLLQPQETQKIHSYIHFSKNAVLGEQKDYEINLYLQSLDSNHKMLIQKQKFMVQLTPKYDRVKNNFLLVINSKTTSDQIKYWQELLGRLSGNNQLAIWNTSLYGEFILDGGYSLLENTTHGTVIILDNDFMKEQEQVHNSQYISKEQIFKAAQQYDVSLLLLGNHSPNRAMDSWQWFDPLKQYISIDQLVHALIDENPHPPFLLHQVELSDHGGCFCLSNISAEEQARQLHERLTRLFPNRNYDVSIKRYQGNNSLVSLRVHRLADTLDRDVKHIPCTEEQLNKPELISDMLQSEVIRAMPFSQKLGLFTAKHTQKVQQILQQAIETDLLNEQSLVLKTKNDGSFLQRVKRSHQRDFSLELKKLQYLVHLLQTEEITNLHIWSPFIVPLIEQICFFAKRHSRLSSRLMHSFLPQAREQVISSTIQLCNEVTRCIKGPVFFDHSMPPTTNYQSIENGQNMKR